MPQYSRWRRRSPTGLGVAAVAGIVLGLLVPQPVSAHSLVFSNTRVPYYSDNFCVRTYGEQSHSYSIIRTETRTSRCTLPLNVGAGSTKHRAEWYADGRYCAYIGEVTSNASMASMQTVINQDVWLLGCNNGPGVNVTITMDTWSWSAYKGYWYPNYGGWPGSRPITGHCHCP